VNRRQRQGDKAQIARIDGVQSTSSQQDEAVMHAVEISSYSGPLPHPDILRSFEEIIPGAAQRIFTQFEEQSSHRREMEARVISSGAFSQRLGTVSASFAGLIGVSGGIWLAHEGKSVVGLATLFTTLASLVGVYLYQKPKQKQELDEKRPKPVRER
jgi:uncharacterized membrane protein